MSKKREIIRLIEDLDDNSELLDFLLTAITNWRRHPLDEITLPRWASDLNDRVTGDGMKFIIVRNSPLSERCDYLMHMKNEGMSSMYGESSKSYKQVSRYGSNLSSSIVIDGCEFEDELTRDDVTALLSECSEICYTVLVFDDCISDDVISDPRVTIYSIVDGNLLLEKEGRI
jgi:hypothetical protein